MCPESGLTEDLRVCGFRTGTYIWNVHISLLSSDVSSVSRLWYSPPAFTLPPSTGSPPLHPNLDLSPSSSLASLPKSKFAQPWCVDTLTQGLMFRFLTFSPLSNQTSYLAVWVQLWANYPTFFAEGSRLPFQKCRQSLSCTHFKIYKND